MRTSSSRPPSWTDRRIVANAVASAHDRYPLVVRGTIISGHDEPDVLAIAWTADTVIALGSDDVGGVSRGDTHVIDLGCANVVPLGDGPAGTVGVVDRPDRTSYTGGVISAARRRERPPCPFSTTSGPRTSAPARPRGCIQHPHRKLAPWAGRIGACRTASRDDKSGGRSRGSAGHRSDPGDDECNAGPVDPAGGNWRNLLNLPKVIRAVRQMKPHAIVAIYLSSYGLMGAVVKGKATLVHVMIGSDLMIAPDRSRLYDFLSRRSLARGDLFVSSSKSMTVRLSTLASIPPDAILTQQYGLEDWVIDHPSLPKTYGFVSNRAWVVNSQIPKLLRIFGHCAFRARLPWLAGVARSRRRSTGMRRAMHVSRRSDTSTPREHRRGRSLGLLHLDDGLRRSLPVADGGDGLGRHSCCIRHRPKS